MRCHRHGAGTRLLSARRRSAGDRYAPSIADLAPQSTPARSARRRSRRGRLLVVGFLLLAAVWVAAAGVLLLRAKTDAESGRDRLVALRDEDAPLRSLLDGGSASLAAAAADFSDANGAVRSPVVAPLRVLPVVGRQLRSFDALTGAAAEVSGVGSEALVEVQSRIDAGTSGAGSDRVGLVRAVGDAARQVGEVLAEVDLGPDDALVGPLADARNTIAGELAEAQELAADAEAVAAGIAPMLEGPTRYLVLAANNAEMEAGSGMFLSAGELSIGQGDLALGQVRATSDVVLPPGEGVELDPDVAALWSFRFPDRDLRGVNVTPRFPTSAEQAARMWVAAGGNPVDGVVALDPVALAAVLRGTGPVVVQGKEFNADNVVDELLHQQYVDFGDARGARQDRQGEVAAATVAALDSGDWDLATLFEDLGEAAAGRHLMVWSSRPVEQRAWEVSGVDGALTTDSLLVGVLNSSGTKLDYFLDVEAELTTSRAPEGTEAALRVVLTNEAPEGEPAYVAGPHPSTDLAEGQYGGILSVSLPGDVTSADVDGAPLVASGRDGPNHVVATSFDVPRGETVERTVRFTLPPGRQGLWLEPAARVPALRWRLEGVAARAESRRYVSW